MCVLSLRRYISPMNKLQLPASRIFLLMLFLLPATSMKAQMTAFPPSDVYQQNRLRTIVWSEVAIGVGVTAGLYFLWYKKFPKSRFHFFNDNAEWLQIDKVGHMTTAYNVAVGQYDLMRWSGVREQPSIAIGAGTALIYMSIIEVLDGFSTHWGFSKTDMLANITGCALFAAQQKLWGEQRASLKFSFHATPFSKYNPSELGNNWRARMLKDYNGQTYWLSFNIHSFLPANSNFPVWLNAAVGYGGEGMTGGTVNPKEVNGKAIPEFKRYRQFYLAPDVDFQKIQYNSGFLRSAAFFTQFIKTPAPALEYNGLKKFKFHPLYF